MKCEVLVSEKLGTVPLVECGSIMLQPGDTLVVSCEKAAELRRHYGNLLVTAEVVLKEALKHGSYEHISRGSTRASVDAAQHFNTPAPAVETVASDRSMQGKTKMRRKG